MVEEIENFLEIFNVNLFALRATKTFEKAEIAWRRLSEACWCALDRRIACPNNSLKAKKFCVYVTCRDGCCWMGDVTGGNRFVSPIHRKNKTEKFLSILFHFGSASVVFFCISSHPVVIDEVAEVKLKCSREWWSAFDVVSQAPCEKRKQKKWLTSETRAQHWPAPAAPTRRKSTQRWVSMPISGDDPDLMFVINFPIISRWSSRCVWKII